MSKHSILLVDDSRESLKSIGSILKKKSLAIEHAIDGKQAIGVINSQKKPFSIIIAGQRLTDMTGTRFLEHIKKMSGDSQRILLTDFSDIDSIIQAVNKGTIQGYIKTPWQEVSLIKVVEQAIGLFERNFENERLMRLAKKQNHKLFELDCELMEKTKSHTREYQALDTEINALKKKISTSDTEENRSLGDPVTLLKNAAGGPDEFDKEKAMLLVHGSIRLLHSQFSDLAEKNGFDMPQPKDHRSC